MTLRNRWNVGSHLMVDEESGLVHYREDMVQNWDGQWRHKDNVDIRNPQEFVRARSDPQALLDVTGEGPQEDVFLAPPLFVGNTTVPTPRGPGYHIYDLGIGEMVVGDSFIVR